jgi:hypothetical protein
MMNIRLYQISLAMLSSFVIPASGQMISSSPNATTPFSGSEDLHIIQNGSEKDTTLSAIWRNILPPATATDSSYSSISVDRGIFTALSQLGTTAQAIFNQAVMSGNMTSFQSYDPFRGISIAPPGSTVNTITGLAGYTLNNTVPSNQRSQTVSLFGVGICAVNNSQCWGVDTIVSDNPSVINTGMTSGSGKYLYNEFDLNITSPNTRGAGLQIGGTALPTSTTLDVNGIAINKLWGSRGVGTGTALFSNGFIAADACCAIGASIGASALSGGNVAGMPVYFNYRDVSGTYQNVSLNSAGNSSGTGYLAVGGTSGAILAAATGLEAGGVGATVLPGDVAMAKGANAATAPGPGYLKLEVVAGTNSGTCKLIAYAGTSTTPTTIADNIGGGC